MRRVLCLLVWCLLGVARVQAQPPDPTPPGDDQPEAAEVHDSYPSITLDDLIKAHNANNWEFLRDLIEDADRDDENLAKAGKELSIARGTLKLSLKEQVLEIENEDASMFVTVVGENHLGLKVVWSEGLRLHRDKEGIWRLRANAPRLVEWNVADGYLQRVIMLVAHPKMRVLQQHNQSARQIKQLSLGVMQFIQDNAQRFAFTQDTIKAEISPYIKSEDIWTAPGDEAGALSYFFNPSLIGKKHAEIWDKSKTVMFYLVKNGELSFPYDGKTTVGFADGHVEILDAKQAKNLRWEP
jgi:prepilin-type processing-associated H-X9-DG protein